VGRGAAGRRIPAFPAGVAALKCPPWPLSPDEIDRYARHLVLPDVGGPGQARLKGRSRPGDRRGGPRRPPHPVPSPPQGVGAIGIVDDDRVSLSNLQRQVIHATGDVGRPKVESAAEAVARLNPHVAVEPHRLRLDGENARGLVARYDVVADGCDKLRDPLRGVRRLLPRGAAPRHRGARPVRRVADHDPGPRDRAGRAAEPHLSLPVPHPPRRPARCRPARRPGFWARSRASWAASWPWR
jgi:adenylyltransferase/sulfurtransferase